MSTRQQLHIDQPLNTSVSSEGALLAAAREPAHIELALEQSHRGAYAKAAALAVTALDLAKTDFELSQAMEVWQRAVQDSPAKEIIPHLEHLIATKHPKSFLGEQAAAALQALTPAMR